MRVLKSLVAGLMIASLIAVPVFACEAEAGEEFEGTTQPSICRYYCNGCTALDANHSTKVVRSESWDGTNGLAALSGNRSISAFIEVRVSGDSQNSRVTGNGYIQTGTYRKGGDHNVKSAHGVN